MLHLALPLLATAIVWLVFWFAIRRQSLSLPLLDVGVLFAAIVVLYTAVPLTTTLVAGAELVDVSDNRLRQLAPDESEIGSFFWNYVIFLAGLTVAYVKTRRDEFAPERIFRVRAEEQIAIVFVGLTLIACIFVFRALVGVQVSTSYLELFEQYQAYSSLPLEARQVIGRLSGALFVTKLALLALVFMNFGNRIWRIGGILWLTAEIVTPFVQLGSRAEAILLLLAAGLLYHTYVRPLGIVVVVTLGFSMLTGFFVFGLVRLLADAPDLLDSTTFLAANEFQSVFSTAFDLRNMRVNEGLAVPWELYMADLLRLIPQQILPFEKIDQSEWYLGIIGAKGLGIGFTFGVIAEGQIGFGMTELILRGAILGAVLGCIHNFCAERSASFYWTVFYIWLCTKIYVSFRVSTFYWLSSIVYEVLPVFLSVKFVASVLSLAKPSGYEQRKTREGST